MSELMPGDIVIYRGQEWAVQGFAPSGRGFPLSVRLGRPLPDGGAEGVTASPGDPVLSRRPTFEEGETVTVGGLDAVVLADNGGDTVPCMTARRKPLRGGGTLRFPDTTTHADRGSLVRDNRVRR